MNIPDAPWIRECEATGYSTYGYWNHPPKEDNDDDEFIYTVNLDDEEEEDEDEDA